jgi:hypothetical protein
LIYLSNKKLKNEAEKSKAKEVALLSQANGIFRDRDLYNIVRRV